MARKADIMPTEAQVFVDWTSRDSDQKATGQLEGRTVTVTGPLGEADLNGQSTVFGTPSVFTPPLPTSDAIELRSKPTDSDFEVDLGAAVEDAVIDLGSLGSIMTIDPDMTVERLSGDNGFAVQGNVVTGVAKNGPPSDSNGTILVSRSTPFSSVKFKLRLNFAGDGEGVFLQVGRTIQFVDWTSRDSDQKATGQLEGRTVTVTGPLGEADLNGQSTAFGTPSVFTPPLPTSDAIELRSKPTDSDFEVDLGAAVEDAVFHLASLGSIMTIDPDMTVEQLSGDNGFAVQGNVVTGVAKNGPPSDSNGTILVSRSTPFSSVKFTLRLNFAGDGEGVLLQVGR
ncbi:hypothetical protein ACFCVY_11165 [Streptomyces sp. NPDC056411]|uniref:hypothetical protein n=1 Tax=Streptomyces sp. NPDC056411 TaxID=3345813 RepID=UPI0035D74908